jgi:hypothetical protein
MTLTHMQMELTVAVALCAERTQAGVHLVINPWSQTPSWSLTLGPKPSATSRWRGHKPLAAASHGLKMRLAKGTGCRATDSVTEAQSAVMCISPMEWEHLGWWVC